VLEAQETKETITKVFNVGDQRPGGLNVFDHTGTPGWLGAARSQPANIEP